MGLPLLTLVTRPVFQSLASREPQWIKPEIAGQQAIGDRADSDSLNRGGFIVEHRSADPKRTRLIGTSPPGHNPRAGFYIGRAAYSITSSARGMIDGGTARPSAMAVLRFTTISYFVGN